MTPVGRPDRWPGGRGELPRVVGERAEQVVRERAAKIAREAHDWTPVPSRRAHTPPDYSYTGRYAGGRARRRRRTLGVILLAAGVGVVVGFALTSWLQGIPERTFWSGIIAGLFLEAAGLSVWWAPRRRRPTR